MVDDDLGMRESLKELLELEGYTVRTAEHGRAGLEQLKPDEKKPCLILLDLMMPVMNGWQFLEAMKQGDAAIGNIPVIVVSALDEAQELQGRYRCDVLSKPLDINKLLETVRTHCRVR